MIPAFPGPALAALLALPPSGRRWKPRPTQWAGLALVLAATLLGRIGMPPVIPALFGLLLIGLPSLARPRKIAEGPGGPEAPFAGRGKKLVGALLLALLVTPLGPCVEAAGTYYHPLFVVLATGPTGALGACPAWTYAVAYAWLAVFFGVAAWQRPRELLAGPEATPATPATRGQKSG